MRNETRHETINWFYKAFDPLFMIINHMTCTDIYYRTFYDYLYCESQRCLYQLAEPALSLENLSKPSHIKTR